MLRSIDHAIYLATTQGGLTRFINDKLTSGTTAATTTSGYVSTQRFPNPFIMPSVGTGITDMVHTYLRMCTSATNSALICGLETTLGTLTVSGNSFSAGSVMPTKNIRDTSVVTASVMPMVFVSTTVVATTPVLTITYTDQDGNTGNTATLTLPTNPSINSCFLIAPHLASGDTGIRAITNLSISTGSAGTIKVIGILPIGSSSAALTPMLGGLDPLVRPLPMFTIAPADVVAFYRISVLAGEMSAVISGVANI